MMMTQHANSLSLVHIPKHYNFNLRFHCSDDGGGRNQHSFSRGCPPLLLSHAGPQLLLLIDLSLVRNVFLR